MDVRNCKGCGKLFNYVSGPPLCAACIKSMDEKFQEVKRYVYDNPSASIQQVSEEMEVSISQIKKWIREERLSFSDESIVGIDCEGCGTMIKTGRFCEKCKLTMATKLGNLYEEPKKQHTKKETNTSAKMRFLDNQ